MVAAPIRIFLEDWQVSMWWSSSGGMQERRLVPSEQTARHKNFSRTTFTKMKTTASSVWYTNPKILTNFSEFWTTFQNLDKLFRMLTSFSEFWTTFQNFDQPFSFLTNFSNFLLSALGNWKSWTSLPYRYKEVQVHSSYLQLFYSHWPGGWQTILPCEIGY